MSSHPAGYARKLTDEEKSKREKEKAEKDKARQLKNTKKEAELTAKDEFNRLKNTVFQKKRVGSGYTLYVTDRFAQLKDSGERTVQSAAHYMNQFAKEWKESAENIKEGFQQKSREIAEAAKAEYDKYLGGRTPQQLKDERAYRRMLKQQGKRVPRLRLNYSDYTPFQKFVADEYKNPSYKGKPLAECSKEIVAKWRALQTNEQNKANK